MFFRTVSLGRLALVVPAILALSSPAAAFDAPSRIDRILNLNGQCSLRAFVQNLNGGLASARVTPAGGSSSTSTQAAGGASFFNGGISTVFLPVTAGNLQANCGLTDVANLIQQGAAGSYATADYVGLSFEGTSTNNGNRYAYFAEVSGATATTVSAGQTLINTAPTVTLGSPSGPDGSGKYTVIATLSESSPDFTSDSLTLINATAAVSSNGGNTFAIVLNPEADGDVSVSVPKGAFTDSQGLENWVASDAVVFSVDATPPTITIGALSGPTAGVYTAEINLSEASTDFADNDLALTNARATLSGSGANYTATLTPAGDGLISLSVAAGRFTDAAGNGNTASGEVTAIFDGTSPTVSITNVPATVNAQSTVTVTITFSEDVTGFESSDILASSATVSSLTGSGAVYQASLTVSGSGAVTLVVPADAAVDGSNNGNLASNSVSIADVTVEETQELIASFTQTRANQLIRSQPRLSGFMSGQARGGFDVNVTRGQSQFSFASNPDYPAWIQAQGSWSSNTTSKSRYLFGALGSHHKVGENLLIGAMVQFDHLTEDTGVASISGTGWMVGPYFVAKSAEQPVYFEGRLLYGETNNTISPFGTYEDDFDTTRGLVQFKVTGAYTNGAATTLYPFLDASYVTDDQHSYVDSLGNTIPGQGINLGQFEVGLDFKLAIPVSSGELELLGGMSGIWSQTGGSGYASTISPVYEGGRMRVELGINRVLSSTQTFNAAAFYDGIGANSFESFGMSLGYQILF